MTSDNPPGFTDDDRRADEEAIHALLHREITAWDAGDPDAYAAVYTPDGDCVSFLGSTTAAARRSGPSRRSMRTNTGIAVRTDDGWLLASHNSSQPPLSEKPLSKLISP